MNLKTRTAAAIMGFAFASAGVCTAAAPEKNDEKTAKPVKTVKEVKKPVAPDVVKKPGAPDVVKKPSAPEKKKPEAKKAPSIKKKGVADDGV